MSTSVHAFFDVVLGNLYFVSVIFNILHAIFYANMQFSASSQNSISKKSIFGQFMVFLLHEQNFPRVGVVISCLNIQREVFY